MFEGLSANIISQLKFRIWQGIMEDIKGDVLTLKEKEDVVKWYSDNIITYADDLVKELDAVKEANK